MARPAECFFGAPLEWLQFGCVDRRFADGLAGGLAGGVVVDALELAADMGLEGLVVAIARIGDEAGELTADTLFRLLAGLAGSSRLWCGRSQVATEHWRLHSSRCSSNVLICAVMSSGIAAAPTVLTRPWRADGAAAAVVGPKGLASRRWLPQDGAPMGHSGTSA